MAGHFIGWLRNLATAPQDILLVATRASHTPRRARAQLQRPRACVGACKARAAHIHQPPLDDLQATAYGGSGWAAQPQAGQVPADAGKGSAVQHQHAALSTGTMRGLGSVRRSVALGRFALDAWMPRKLGRPRPRSSLQQQKLAAWLNPCLALPPAGWCIPCLPATHALSAHVP